MLTAFVATVWLVGFMMGGITVLAVAVYMDGRTEKRIAAEKAEARRTNPIQFQKDLDRERDRRNMEAAEQLVQDKLGAEVLSVEKTV